MYIDRAGAEVWAADPVSIAGMRNRTSERIALGVGWVFEDPSGFCARVVASWVLAGGIMGGGVLIGTLSLSGVGSPGLYLLIAPVLFLVGTGVGFTHGIALALLGRPDECPLRRAGLGALLGALTALPLLGLAWVLASGVTLTVAVGEEGYHWSLVVVSAVAWVAALTVCVWAAIEGARAAKIAYMRCPHRRVGAALLGGLFIATCLIAFRVPSDAIWPDLRWGAAAPLLVATLGTLWLWTPIVWGALHFARRSEVISRPSVGP